MIYLSTFARPKGSKDKQKRKRKNSSLAENLAIVSAPSLYANYLLGQAFQTADRNILAKNLKRTALNIKDKQQAMNDRREEFYELEAKIKERQMMGKPISNTDAKRMRILTGYRTQTGEKFLRGRELIGLENSIKRLPKLQKRWKKVEKVAVPENWKEGLTIKKKFMTPSRLGVTLLGGAGTTILTGALLNKLRDK